MSEQWGRLRANVKPKENIKANISIPSVIGGSDDYEKLKNLPSVNEHTLIGDSSFEDIGLHFMTNVEIRDLLRRD